MSKYIVEVCAGNITDCINAQVAGADRIELVSATYLGGLTPSLGLVTKALEKVDIPIIAMVRPRGGGFNYNQDEIDLIFLDAKLMLEAGVAGIVFGFLNEDLTVDVKNTKKMVDLCKSYNKEAVYHKAFDITPDLDETTKILIDLGVDRILTSGGMSNVDSGLEKMKELNEKYGNQIEFLAGGGVNINNGYKLIKEANITQLHGTFKSWGTDKTTVSKHISYSYSDLGDYEFSDTKKIKEFIKSINKKEK